MKNEQALVRYARQPKPGLDERKGKDHNKIIPHLKNSDFWTDLQLVKTLLEPIHEIQYISEAEDYPLYKVAKNWNRIRAHLYSMARAHPEIDDLQPLPEHVWEDRFLTQCTPLHITAALLLPENWNTEVVGVTTRSGFNSIMMEFFERYAGSPASHESALSAMKEWLDFRSQINGFEPNAACWRAASDPDLFWALAEGIAPHLSMLARRVMKIPGNSVLAERDWSVLNLIKNKTRNSLQNVKVDKLMYIYMNQRTLNRPRDLKRRLRFTQGVSFDENELMDMEDRLLEEESVRDRLPENYRPDIDFSEILPGIQQPQGGIGRE